MRNNRLSSQGNRQRRFFRQHIIALSVVSLITLLAIALIVWILLTQNTSQSTFLISIVVGIVTIVFGPTSWYIWIIERSKKSGEQQQNAHVQDQQITGDQVTASTLPEPSTASTTYRPLSNGSPMQTQTPVLTTADAAHESVDRRWANVASERTDYQDESQCQNVYLAPACHELFLSQENLHAPLEVNSDLPHSSLRAILRDLSSR